MNVNKENGFTLVELLVVISIIGILATIVLTSLTGARQKTYDTKRLSQVEQLQKALFLYNLDNNTYPGGSYPGGWASNCIDAPSQATKYANWEILLSDLDAYISNIEMDSNWPFCIYYTKGSYNQCDKVINPEYTILFATEDKAFSKLDELNSQADMYIGNSKVRYCMYPL